MELLTPTGYKNIDEINIGDELIAFDVSTGQIIHNTLLDKKQFSYDMLPPNEDVYKEDENGDEVLESSGKTSEEVFIDTYGEWKFFEINGTWKLFKNQSIWANGRVIHVSELNIGDVIYNDENEDVIVNSIEEKSASIWWKLTVSGDHSYIADGISLHNSSRYWSGNMTPTSFNWTYTTGGTNWGSATGVADNASVPTSTDDVVFDGAGIKGNSNSTVSANITILSLTFTSGYTGLVTINSTLTLTIAGNFTDNTAHTWAVGNSSCFITISSTSTINGGGMTFPGNVSFTNTNTKTLSADWTILGSFQLGTPSSITTLNGPTFILSANGHNTQFNAALNGTAIFRITGGIITLGGGGSGVTGISQLQFAGNFTIPSMTFGGTILKYISGTVISSGTINPQLSTTFDTYPIVWSGVNLPANGSYTHTINSLLLVSGTMQIAYNGATIFSGTAGFTVGTLTLTNTNGLALTHTFQTGNTYTVTTALNPISSVNGGTTFSSNSGVNRVNFILQQGATCNTNLSFTRIDNTAGRTINTWNGNLTNTLNCKSFTDLQTVGKTFVS